MKPTTPTEGHRWLQQFVGDWTFESESATPEAVCKGTERVRRVGDLWIVGESEMHMSGEVAKAVITLGYDPRREKFCGTWVGDMMAHLWIYEGELDPTRRVLRLYSEGPSFTEDGEISPTELSRYRDEIEVHEEGHRTFSSFVQDPAGEWQRFMVTHYRRASGVSSR